MSDGDEHIALIERRLLALEDEKRRLETEIHALRLHSQQKRQESIAKNVSVSLDPVTPDRIKLFLSLFSGRPDVFPKRWDNAKTGRAGYSPTCGNEWVKGVCNKPRIPCSACTHQAWLPVTEDVIRKHLCGDTSGWQPRDYTIGVYPMLKDETCWFLAVDFDKENWQRDVAAFVVTCRKKNVPVVVERSRSGNGAHAWIFFARAIAASIARKLGSALLTETMEQCPDIGFESYDRLFPNQDTMPTGGFGNLIALPFQKTPRSKGNSVFVDENFVPYPDQWGFLQSIRRMAMDEVLALVDDASLGGRILGVRMPVDEDEGEPWLLPPSRKKPIAVSGTLPKTIKITIGNQLYIPKQDLPPPLINRLIRLAAFQNPEFYAAQAMRLSTFDKSRISFVLRLREDMHVFNNAYAPMPLVHVARNLRVGQKMILKGSWRLGQNEADASPPARLIILRLESGELLSLATDKKPKTALARYRARWKIETLFAALKTRGFDLEATHITKPEKLALLVGVLAITAALAYKTGLWATKLKPTAIKKHGRLAKSIFRRGLETLKKLLANPDTSQIKNIFVGLLSYKIPANPLILNVLQ